MSGLDSSFNLGLPFLLASQSQKHVTFNEAIVSIDNLLMLAVKSRNLASPPTTPIEGDRYIIPTSPNGDWVGQAGQVAAYNNLGWAFYPPKAGFICYVADENAVIFFDGAGWKHLSLTAADFQNLASIGIGTSADGNNPFALKANNALFTAKYTIDGGSGDIRLKLNKEAKSKTTSFIFQNNWSGRAEFGLCGDDDFNIKTSADGNIWRNSLGINNVNGYLKPVTISQNPNAGLRPAYNAVTDLRIIGQEGQFTTIMLEGTGAGVTITGRASRGTLEAPTATVNDQTLFSIGGSGRNDVDYLTSSPVLFFLRAAENWTSTANGSYIGFAVTPNGTTTRINAMKIDNDGGFKPFVDNAFSLGGPSLRFSTLYAATGTINTSDARDKIVEGEIDGATATKLLKAIEPKIYRWKVGSNVPDLENYEQDKDGNEFTSPNFKTIAGTRKHAGFLAQDVKAALDEIGLDLGVWGLDDKNNPNAKQWLRPDQMIPILWAAVREMAFKQ